MIAIRPLDGLPEVCVGDDLGAMLAARMGDAADGDILVVTQKIVSKAEGRMVALDSLTPSQRALEFAQTTGKDPRLVELVLAESTEIVRAVPGVLIVQHRLGLVMANAGIDGSNIGPGEGERVLLLPVDPDASAARIADAIAERTGKRIGVVISDSFGRAWRHGVTNVAIGAAGVPSIADIRGKADRDGRPLQATLVAYGDLIASAAGLAMGEAGESVPAVLISGLALPHAPRLAADLIRAPAEDLFR